MQMSSESQSDSESTEAVMHKAKRKTQEIKDVEKSIDRLYKEILKCQQQIKAFQQKMTRLPRLNDKLNSKFVLPPF